MDGGTWWAAVHWVAKSRTRLSDFFHFSLSCVGEGNGNPLQCSCWRIPGTEEPGGLLSMGSHRVGHDWSDLAVCVDPSLPIYPFLPSTLVTISLFSTSVFPFLFCKSVHLYHFYFSISPLQYLLSDHLPRLDCHAPVQEFPGRGYLLCHHLCGVLLCRFDDFFRLLYPRWRHRRCSEPHFVRDFQCFRRDSPLKCLQRYTFYAKLFRLYIKI